MFVGNGAHSGMGVTGRDSLQSGVLDLRVLRAHGPFPGLAVLGRLLVGCLRGSPLLRQALVREVRLGLPEPMPLSLDGEVLDDVAGGIAFRSLPGALRVVVPAPERPQALSAGRAPPCRRPATACRAPRSARASRSA